MREKILKDTLYLTSRSVFIRALHFPVALVTAHVLGPEIFGLLQVINHIPSLAKFGNLGYGSVALREMLHMRGSGATEGEAAVRDVSFTADLVCSSLLVLMVIAASFFFESQEVKWGLRITAVSLFLVQLARLYVVNLKLQKNFGLLASVQTVSQVFGVAVILATIWFWGIYSILVSGVITGLVGIILYQRLVGLHFRPSFNPPELARLTRIALPFALGTVAYGAFGWVERGLVGALYGLNGLGIYMLTVTAIPAGLMFANSLMQAISVHLYQRLGGRTTQGGVVVGNMVYLPTVILTYLFTFIGAVTVFMGPPVIHAVLPAYTGVIPLLPWLAAILWIRVAPLLYLTSMNSAALNQQLRFGTGWVITICCFVAITWPLSALGVGLQAAMAGKLGAFLVLAVIGVLSTRNHLNQSKSQLVTHLISYFVPLAWGGTAVLVAWQIGHDTWATGLLSLGVFTILYAPLAVWRIIKLRLLPFSYLPSLRGIVGKKSVAP